MPFSLKTRFLATVAFSLFLVPAHAQVTETGPYTVTQLAPGVKRIEDSNKANPAGTHLGADGKPVTNNCSDMYLIEGTDKVLLIDLSNFVRWDTSAVRSLRAIVYGAKGTKGLYITGTHRHGDHLGMLPAFKDDPQATFWVRAEEYPTQPFPKERTTGFPENASLDLGGGFVVNSLELPGHTDHSTIFFLRGKNLVFTGDALGSGHGVWIFSYDGFMKYNESITKLINYIQNPANQVNAQKLLVYPGHYWQRREKENLPMQYILDMRTLIGKIKEGKAEEEKVKFNNYLDTEFKYGTAIITWNKADELKYVEAK